MPVPADEVASSPGRDWQGFTGPKNPNPVRPGIEPPARPRELVDVQRQLVLWWRSPQGFQAARMYIDTDREAAPRRRRLLDEIDPDDIVSVEAYALARAVPYWISGDMAALVWHAADTWPAPKLRADMLPSSEGFAYFERPLFPFPIGRQAASIRAVRWAVVEHGGHLPGARKEPGVMTTWYSSLADGGDTALAEQTRKATPDQLAAYQPTRLVLLSFSFWPFGSVAEPGMFAPSDAGTLDPSYAWNHERYIKCLWAMMRQTIVRTVRHVDRHAAKRARRANLDQLAESGVRIITLRREQPPKEAGERTVESRHVDWSCRWIVGAGQGGHWHRYHTHDGVVSRWVAPYVKGPEGKPLRFSKPIYRFSR